MTLVLVPGHLCDARLYAPQLADYPDALVADVTRDDTVVGMAARLLDMAPATFSLAGLSMGGMVAMEVMRQAPDRVTSALLLATDPTPAREKEVAWRADMNDAGLPAFARTFSQMFFAHDADCATRLRPDAEAMMIEMGGALYLRQSHALNTRPDLREAMASCSVPTLILAGSEDRICPPRLHHDLADTMLNAQLQVIEGCGHIITLERPDRVNAALGQIV
ncbi:alpha/beta fold hydrolase [Pontivivens insulae]|uniref:Non-heme bromoperoxidase BpoC n=1 Tax=Pontivivens insulae TaxID=1639689 RepID=A0A2R8A9B6_9RHOB|nr:alpha/beta fold hydrolase [Pontivivens insulae]RED18730.1 pimeloyl-ACP methyl ester carboxylesterase [Pontivivens insulae]SPF28628.1 Putative non-heme bromoperoxidase BpoC [Pontivivens insulae]